MFAPNFHLSYLPSINTRVESVRLLYGSLLRLCLHSGLYYGCCRLLFGYLRKQKDATARAERDGLCYLLSMGVEVGLSVLLVPCRYLAATTAPRFLLDFMLTSWSDKLSLLDLFRPGQFASYATYAFSSSSDGGISSSGGGGGAATPLTATTTAAGADWNFDFFVWQMPSVLLSLGKLCARRRAVGAAATRTRRVLLALGVQVVLRAYMATFSTMLPEDGAEAVNAVLVTVLEGIATSYVVRHTWPFALREDAATPSTPSTGTLDDTEHTASTDGSRGSHSQHAAAESSSSSSSSKDAEHA